MTKLYRSTRDKKIFGLCGGLAEVFNIDATVLRLIVAIGVVFSGGTVLLLYLVASMVIPKEQGHYHNQQSYSSTPWNHGGVPPVPPVPPTPQPPMQHKTSTSAEQPASNIDDLMKDIEKKAMQKEIEELKARLAKLEKGDE